MRKSGLFLLIILVLIIPGCAKQQDSNEIIIGVAWPFEKSKDFFEEGIDLALEEINKNGGIDGKVLKLIKKDDEEQLTKAMLVAQDFADTENIKAVIGHKNSFISIPVSAIYDEAGIVMMSPASTSPELTKKGYKNIFRMISDDNEIAQAIAAYIADEGHQKIVVYYSDDSYGVDLANSFEDRAKEYGIIVVDRFKYYQNKNDLMLLEKRWRAFGYDGIFIASSANEGANFIKISGEANIRKPMFSGNSLDVDLVKDIAGDFAEGLVVASVFDKDNSEAIVQNFVTAFTKKYGKYPDEYAALGYDSLYRIVEAINNSRATGSDELYKEMELLQTKHGVASRDIILKKLTSGNFEVIK